MKYLKLYQEWMEAGKMPENGLCASLNWDEKLNIFIPTPAEFGMIHFDKYSTCKWDYWAVTGIYNPLAPSCCGVFTPLRQTILLLMAAMNDEL